MNQYNNKGNHHGYWEHYWIGDFNQQFVAYKGYYNNGEMINLWETFNQNRELTNKEFYL
jgi:hypothetical protein